MLYLAHNDSDDGGDGTNLNMAVKQVQQV